MKYLIVDGVVQKATPEVERWARRASQAVPTINPDPEDNPKVDLKDRRTEYEVIESLEGFDE
jgi:hypothetical protein